jgi:hypothetical protein
MSQLADVAETHRVDAVTVVENHGVVASRHDLGDAPLLLISQLAAELQQR